MEAIIQLITIAVLIAIGYFTGKHYEDTHFKSIKEREAALVNLPALTMPLKDVLRQQANQKAIERAELVMGNIVISPDYFKIFVGGLVSLFGGGLPVFESVVDRARRESVLRLKEKAMLVFGHVDMIVNLRIETSRIGGNSNEAISSVEAFAYGTAIKLKDAVHP
ncbi:MAG: heavy metal-binding domain-containing protein [Candidatus Caenarcaniphilales bacterium]|nr:heavy metal-binding domain-containing protein [Candidatus Caenarcaniphilales bacterium]